MPQGGLLSFPGLRAFWIIASRIWSNEVESLKNPFSSVSQQNSSLPTLCFKKFLSAGLVALFWTIANKCVMRLCTGEIWYIQFHFRERRRRIRERHLSWALARCASRLVPRLLHDMLSVRPVQRIQRQRIRENSMETYTECLPCLCFWSGEGRVLYLALAGQREVIPSCLYRVPYAQVSGPCVSSPEAGDILDLAMTGRTLAVHLLTRGEATTARARTARCSRLRGRAHSFLHSAGDLGTTPVTHCRIMNRNLVLCSCSCSCPCPTRRLPLVRRMTFCPIHPRQQAVLGPTW